MTSPGTNAADDFDFIRTRIGELKREKEEAEKQQGNTGLGDPTQGPTQTPEGEWIYGKDAFKMEHLSPLCSHCLSDNTKVSNISGYVICNDCHSYTYISTD
jgi:hypothetical protein